MLDRAKVKLRSLESFGVSGQLSPESEIFYTSLFSTKHLGRVTDLLCARLEKSGVDELKLRVSVIMSVFEACYGLSSSKGRVKTATPLPFPLSLEVGVDEEKVAVGISFNLNSAQTLNTEGLPIRLADGIPEGKLEKFLFDIRKNSDLMFLKHDPDSRKFEIVALIAHDAANEGATPSGNETELPQLEILTLGRGKTKDAPRAKHYSDLGDLNYPELLRDDKAGDVLEESHSGEILDPEGEAQGKAKERQKKDSEKTSSLGKLGRFLGFKKKDESEDEKFEGDSEDGAQKKVKGSGEESDSSSLVKGQKSGRSDEQRIKDLADDSSGDENRRVKGLPDEKEGLARVKLGLQGEDDRTRVKGSGAETDDRNRVKGTAQEDELSTRIKGTTDRIEDRNRLRADQQEKEGQTRIKGATERIEDRNLVRGRPEAEDELSEGELSEKEASKPKPKRSLWRRIRSAPEDQEGVQDSAPTVFVPRKEGAGIIRTAGRAIRNLIGYFSTEEVEESSQNTLPPPPIAKVPTQKKPQAKAVKPGQGLGVAQEQSEDQGVVPSVSEQEVPEPSTEGGVEKPQEGASEETDLKGLESQTKTLVNELHGGGLDHVLRVAQWESVNLKRDLKNQQANKWIDNLMGSLNAERTRLAELGKKIHGSVRNKEMEFKDKVGVLQEELRKKDVAIAQKTAALARTKDQLSKVTESNEKLKMIAQNSEDDIHYKQKYDMTHKMLELAKDENVALAQKVEDLKGQMSANAAASKSTPAMASQMMVLQQKYERLFKQTEEFKKSNRQLMEKLKEPRRTSVGSEELRKKMEIAMKMLQGEKQEKLNLKSQLVTQHQESARLREELKRMQLENKHLAMLAQQAKRNNPGSSGTGGGSSTPPRVA